VPSLLLKYYLFGLHLSNNAFSCKDFLILHCGIIRKQTGYSHDIIYGTIPHLPEGAEENHEQLQSRLPMCEL
jgi:hypothetical protein